MKFSAMLSKRREKYKVEVKRKLVEDSTGLRRENTKLK